MNRIQSKSHNIGTYRINKISLPGYDDKKKRYWRFIQNNFTKYRQVILSFGLNRTSISSAVGFE